MCRMFAVVLSDLRRTASGTRLPGLTGASNHSELALIDSISSIFALSTDPEFGFDMHNHDGSHLLRKLRTFPYFERGRGPRNCQLVPEVQMWVSSKSLNASIVWMSITGETIPPVISRLPDPLVFISNLRLTN